MQVRQYLRRQNKANPNAELQKARHIKSLGIHEKNQLFQNLKLHYSDCIMINKQITHQSKESPLYVTNMLGLLSWTWSNHLRIRLA